MLRGKAACPAPRAHIPVLKKYTGVQADSHHANSMSFGLDLRSDLMLVTWGELLYLLALGFFTHKMR